MTVKVNEGVPNLNVCVGGWGGVGGLKGGERPSLRRVLVPAVSLPSLQFQIRNLNMSRCV